MNNLRWSWGLTKEKSQWFLRTEDLDTGLYAVAYYSTDDEDPMRAYESQSPELLHIIINAEGSNLYNRCKDMKDMHLGLQKGFDNISVANFM